MSLAIIDAREWQNRFNLETGAKETRNHPLASMVSDVLSKNPYPGDIDDRANQWVTNTALDLINSYGPRLVCLSYVQQFFAHRHQLSSPDQEKALFSTAMDQAFAFLDKSGYIPVLVGTGPMVPLAGAMDLSGLDGLAISSNWSARYCGIHSPSTKDLETLRSMEAMECLKTQEEWIELFKSVQPDLDLPQDPDLMPDFLAVARQGYAFKTMGATLRPPVNLLAKNVTVPVYTTLGTVTDLRQIRPLIRKNLGAGKKIALIIMEGIGSDYFPENTQHCQNGQDWFCNEPADAFYLTLSTGKHQPFAYPQGYRSFDQDADKIKFPFSGYLNEIPDHTLAESIGLPSIAVGNRSMYMHLVFGTDIGVECFARNLFNQGCLGVIHPPFPKETQC